MHSKVKNKNNKKKRNNKYRVIFIIVAVAFIVICSRFYISLIKTKMVPTKYITIIAIVGIIVILLIALGLVKRHKTIKLNIFCLLIAIIISGSIIFANTYIDATMKFLNKIFANFSEIEEYYVIVNIDSVHTNLEDTNGKKVYEFQIEEDIRNKIKEKANVEFVISESLIEMGNNLLSKKIEFIIVSASQYNMLDDEIDGLKGKTKIIDTETHEIKNQKQIENENSDYKIDNGKFNIYISGIDTYGNINNVSRSDANIIATVNLNTHEILLTSIPRDYYVTLHSKQAKDKLTHSGIYGINETVTTVEDLLEIDINYYLRVNFTTLIKLVDTLGGVDVYSDYNFTSTTGYRFQKGYNHLNGEAALSFSRERSAFKEGDNQRIKDQQKVIEAIINKVSNSSTILTKYTSILDSLFGCFNTNINQDDIAQIVKEQLENMPKWTINTISLSGTGKTSSTYSMGSQQLYVMIPDNDSIEDAKNKIYDILGM